MSPVVEEGIIQVLEHVEEGDGVDDLAVEGSSRGPLEERHVM